MGTSCVLVACSTNAEVVQTYKGYEHNNNIVSYLPEINVDGRRETRFGLYYVPFTRCTYIHKDKQVQPFDHHFFHFLPWACREDTNKQNLVNPKFNDVSFGLDNDKQDYNREELPTRCLRITHNQLVMGTGPHVTAWFGFTNAHSLVVMISLWDIRSSRLFGLYFSTLKWNARSCKGHKERARSSNMSTTHHGKLGDGLLSAPSEVPSIFARSGTGER